MKGTQVNIDGSREAPCWRLSHLIKANKTSIKCPNCGMNIKKGTRHD